MMTNALTPRAWGTFSVVLATQTLVLSVGSVSIKPVLIHSIAANRTIAVYWRLYLVLSIGATSSIVLAILLLCSLAPSLSECEISIPSLFVVAIATIIHCMHPGAVFEAQERPLLPAITGTLLEFVTFASIACLWSLDRLGLGPIVALFCLKWTTMLCCFFVFFTEGIGYRQSLNMSTAFW